MTGPVVDHPVRAGTHLGVLVGGTRYGLPKTNEPAFCLDLLDLDRGLPEDDPARVPLDFLPHGFSAHPTRPREAVVFEKHGPGARHIDLVAEEALAPIAPLPGHHFYGHGAFSRDGSVLYVVETHLDSGDGVISIRDSSTFASLGTFPTHGKAPHDCQLIEDGKTLVITNGGGAVDSQAVPSVVFVDVATQKLLERHEPDGPGINMGHVAVTRSDRELAVVSAQRDGLPAETSRGGVSLRRKAGALGQLLEPRAITDRFLGESLSVCIHEPTRRVAATHPFGHCVSLWNLDTSALLAAVDLPNPRGVTLTRDGGTFAISFGPAASLLLVSATTLRVVPGRERGRRCFGGSHIFSSAYPG